MTVSASLPPDCLNEECPVRTYLAKPPWELGQLISPAKDGRSEGRFTQFESVPQEIEAITVRRPGAQGAVLCERRRQ